MITEQDLNNIVQYVQQQQLSESVVSELRKQYSPTHFTYCLDDDIVTGNPVFECDTFNLYAIDTSDHCSVLTQDLNTATGLVIAEMIE